MLGRELAKTVAELTKPELAKMPQSEVDEFWRLIYHSASLRVKQSQVAEQPKPVPNPQPNREPKKGIALDCQSRDVERALELVDEILELQDEMPSRASDFTISVVERATEIGETVEEREFASEGQIEALENMLAGMQRWLR